MLWGMKVRSLRTGGRTGRDGKDRGKYGKDRSKGQIKQ